jgi:hypothetical protein
MCGQCAFADLLDLLCAYVCGAWLVLNQVAITIENGAHHQDLNGGHSPTDTPDMLAARAQEKATLGRWLKEVQAERRSKREAAI